MLRAEVAIWRGALDLRAAVEVADGSCLALAGPSGAGKTTLLRIVAGLARHATGVVHVAGECWLDTARRVDLPPERRRCGYVFQDYALFPHLTVRDNVAYGLRGSRRARQARADELLERFDVRAFADARPGELSGGERQRVALARALAIEPRALLLDEPLAALDTRTRRHATRELARAIRAAAVPTVLVTHDFTDAALLGDEVAVIDAGRIVQRGSAAELAAKPASAFVADFTGAVVLTGTAAQVDHDLTRVRLDGGGELVAPGAAAGRVAVSVYPWDIIVAPTGARDPSSARNHLEVEVVSVTAVGGRVRLGLVAPQPLSAEITASSAHRLEIAEGSRLTASWKAAATRIVQV